MKRPGIIPRLLALLVLIQVSFAGLAPVLAPVRDQFGVSNQEIALLVASAGVARFLFDLPAGSLIGRFDRGLLLSIACVIATLSGVIGALANTFLVLVIARALTGFGSTLAVTAALAHLTETVEPRRRGMILGSFEATFWFGAAIGAVSSGWIAASWGWNWSFAFGGVCALAALGLALTLPTMRALHIQRTGAAGGYRAAFAAGHLRLFGTLAFVLAVYFQRFGFSSTLAPLYAAGIGLDASQVGATQAATSLIGVAAVLAGGWLGDRIGRAPVAAAALILLAVTTVAYTRASDFTGLLLASAALGVAGFGTGMGPALIADSLPTALRARGVALFRLLGDFCQMVAPLLAGLSLDLGSYTPLLVAMTTILVLSAALVFLGFRLKPTPAVVSAT